jgi:N-acyl-L-homoserine lactone synthetase
MTKTNDIIDSLLNVKTFNRFNVEEEAKDFFKGLLRLRSQVFKSKKEDWDFISVL